MSLLLVDIITGTARTPFAAYYDSAKRHFSNIQRFCELSGEKCSSLDWPENPGVYVIWTTNNDPNETLYVGMTSYFSNDGSFKSNQGLKGRARRWTPYRFDSIENTFCYGPLYRKGEKSTKGPPEAGYSQNIPVSHIRIDCFLFNREENQAPAFLEALFLQGYIAQYKRLPAANNRF